VSPASPVYNLPILLYGLWSYTHKEQTGLEALKHFNLLLMSSMFLDIFWLTYKDEKKGGFVIAMVVLSFIVKPVTIWNCSQQLRKGISLPHNAGLSTVWHGEREPLYDNVPDSPDGKAESSPKIGAGKGKGNASGKTVTTTNFDQL
jgi:hypothetical protein